MMLDAILRLASTPSPSPKYNADLVTPGVIGFVITFLIAVATVLLIIDMTRRIRRVRYRAEIAAKLDAEAAEAADDDERAEPDGDRAGDDHERSEPENHDAGGAR